MADKIVSITLNNDRSRFTVTTDHGYRVYGIFSQRFPMLSPEEKSGRKESLKILFTERNTFADPLLKVYSYLSTNFVVYLTRKNEKLLRVRCHSTQKDMGEIECRTPILNVLFRRGQIITVTEERILFYKIDSLEFLYLIETYRNPTGVSDINETMFICPGLKPGTIYLEKYDTLENRKISLTGSCHLTIITQMKLSPDSKMIATSSEKGTVIRIFDTQNLTLLHELKRGSSPTTIRCLDFSSDSKSLVLASENGTIHCWSLDSLKPAYFESRIRGSVKISLSDFSDCSGFLAFKSDSSTLKNLYCLMMNGKVYHWEINEIREEAKIQPTYTLV